MGQRWGNQVMKNLLSPDINITEEGDEIPLDINLKDESHYLSAKVDADNGDIYLSFSSRVAMYDFARNLLHESIYGSGSIELYPLGSNDKLHIVNGVRLSLDSSRIFIECAIDKD